MLQEHKELLLKDLCARLPYGVKFLRESWNYEWDQELSVIEVLEDIDKDGYINRTKVYNVEDIKPYLFPLSSMTEEMLEELNANGFFKYRDTIVNVSHLESKNGISKEIYTYIDIESISFLIEYFHSHHIDYRGLIPMGLAIDATGLNIY